MSLSLNGLVVLIVYVLLCTVQDCVNLPVDDVVLLRLLLLLFLLHLHPDGGHSHVVHDAR